MDVALGDGVDTIYLLQQGFDVSANEVDSAFHVKAIENANKQGFTIHPTNLDWRELNRAYQPESFDAVICLGNSLTCLFGRENYLEALRQFRRVLKRGGALLIDERNFQRILDNREDVIAGRLHSSGKYLYTGTGKVRATFESITDEEIIIKYMRNEDGKVAYYRVYPFKRGELLGILQGAGFSQIEQFSDYELGDQTEADFYQYVCVR